MRIDGIIWLEDVEHKIWDKHRVQPDEVEAVLESDPHVRFVERGLRQGEDVYSALGRTPGGRYLIVYYVYRPE